MTEIYQRLFPQKYASKLLNNEIRRDFRNLTQYRPISIESNPLPQCPVSSQVTIGATAVLCALSYELGLPSIFNQQQGQLHLKLTLPATAGEHAQSLHPREREVEMATIQQTLSDFLMQRSWIDLSCLYITDKCVWNIIADITIISHDGNLFDACLIALQHAFELSTQQYSLNIPYLPITILTALREREKQRIEDERTRLGDDYRPSAYSLQMKTNGFIEADIPTLKVSPQTLDSTIPIARQIGIISADQINAINTSTQDGKAWKSTFNALSKDDFPTLLYPPIILLKKLYPTQFAIIKTQSVEYPEPEDKEMLSEEELVQFYKKHKPAISSDKVLILDPTYSETAMASSILQILFDGTGKICFYQKTAGEPISPSELMRCLQLGASHCGRLSRIITQTQEQQKSPQPEAQQGQQKSQQEQSGKRKKSTK